VAFNHVFVLYFPNYLSALDIFVVWYLEAGVGTKKQRPDDHNKDGPE
jgi:hypothetical protein